MALYANDLIDTLRRAEIQEKRQQTYSKIQNSCEEDELDKMTKWYRNNFSNNSLGVLSENDVKNLINSLNRFEEEKIIQQTRENPKQKTYRYSNWK